MHQMFWRFVDNNLLILCEIFKSIYQFDCLILNYPTPNCSQARIPSTDRYLRSGIQTHVVVIVNETCFYLTIFTLNLIRLLYLRLVLRFSKRILQPLIPETFSNKVKICTCFTLKKLLTETQFCIRYLFTIEIHTLRHNWCFVFLYQWTHFKLNINNVGQAAKLIDEA